MGRQVSTKTANRQFWGLFPFGILFTLSTRHRRFLGIYYLPILVHWQISDTKKAHFRGGYLYRCLIFS